jgi:hypothetical protein
MGDKKYSQILFSSKLLDKFQYLSLDSDIQGSGRFIGNEELRFKERAMGYMTAGAYPLKFVGQWFILPLAELIPSLATG